MKPGSRRHKVLITILTLMMIASAFGSVSAAADGSRLDQKVFGTPEELLVPNNYTVAVFNGAVGKEDGTYVMYATSKGKPGHLNVIDLEDYKLLRSIPIGPSESSWAHTVAPDGTLFLAADGGGARLWAYSPETKTPVQVTQFEGQSVPNSITTDEQGRVYVGTYPDGKVFQYDPATQETRDYGRVIGVQDKEYVRSIAYQGGNVYAGTAHKQIVRVNLETGEKTNIAGSLTVQEDTVYDLSTIDDRYLFARYTDGSGIPGEGYIYDTQTEAWLDVELQNVTGLHATDSVDGKLYYMSDQKLKTFDLTTYAVEETGMTYGSGFRGADWIELDDPEFPGKTLVTVRYDGGVAMLNIETKQVHVKPPVIPGLPGVVNRVQSVSETQLITTGSQARSSLVDLNTMTAQPFSIGQADSVYAIGDKVYMGVYPEGALFEYDLTKQPGDGNPKKLSVLGNQQERLVHMSEGEGKLFISTISGYGALGGSVTVYDPSTGETKVHRNIVENQSVLSTAYTDGKLFGSTTIRGGLGSEPVEEEAKIFVWDVENEEKVTEFSLNLPGMTEKPIFIGDLSLGPDGLIWGASYEYIFAIDPDTYEVVKSKKIYPKLYYTYWHHHPMRWSEDGLLYVLFNNKLTVIDPETLDFRTLADTSRFDLGMDGHLYFTDSATNTILYRIQIDGEYIPEEPGTPQPVPNSGFEEGSGTSIPGWSPLFAAGADTFYSISSEKVYKGSQSLKTVDRIRTGSVALQSDKIPVQGGLETEAGVQVYIESGQPGFMFRFYDENNATITTWEKHLDETRLGQWQTVKLTGTAPENATHARLIAVTSRYNMATAYYDDFFVNIKEEAAPVSRATVNPQPNSEGWNNSDVNVSIEAADAATIMYSAEGAQTLESTAVSGTSAELNITQEGVTTVTYGAEGATGVQETPQTLEVKIDKTGPELKITGKTEYEVNEFVSIGCEASDQLSGLSSNPCEAPLLEGPAYTLAAQDVTVTAEDLAGNVSEVTATVTIHVSYSGVSGLVDQFLEGDSVKARILNKKLEDAQAAEQQGKMHLKENMLNAFTNQVKAFSGNQIQKEHADILISLAAQL
ncbi:PQQ-binding-like beta-propeller repeat protein [Paenibacillus lemnae]|uniref:Uncharacterized protein n=1 Tax=Paenibacillus lemnae TaxID=1330551 RepID=A0A848M3X2_PAELE|nr:PQQ-binding-like beta-propeller repeat protein [Paenibacillus lemnae]NMO94374.1 hypothetical protein [Paenibacillus lemnae]